MVIEIARFRIVPDKQKGFFAAFLRERTGGFHFNSQMKGLWGPNRILSCLEMPLYAFGQHITA